MARLIYGLSGEGRGHASRGLAVASQLRKRGHEVRFCCGGVARTMLERRGEDVIPVPSLEYVLEENRLRLWRTACNIVPELTRTRTVINRLRDVFTTYNPSLVIADFEAFSTWVAEQLGVPVLSLNNQQIITETEYSPPPRERLNATIARLAIQFITPQQPAHIVLPFFYDLPLKHPDHVTLIPPILRSDIRALQPFQGDHVLVYYSHGSGAGEVLRSLETAKQKSVVYGFPEESVPEQTSYLEMRPPSREGFLEDLATSRAVISTAGFTVISEALYLGKPILVVPIKGIFEQTMNARFLERLGLGEHVDQQDLTAELIQEFLDRAEQYRSRPASHVGCGTQRAVDRIEEELRNVASQFFVG